MLFFHVVRRLFDQYTSARCRVSSGSQFVYIMGSNVSTFENITTEAKTAEQNEQLFAKMLRYLQNTVILIMT